MAKKRKKTKAHVPAQNDDGTRWVIVDSDDYPVYLSKGGATRAEAERLNQSLVTRGTLKEIQP